MGFDALLRCTSTTLSAMSVVEVIDLDFQT